ncbi:hypothetical protein Anapl_08908 [Anas platyrhynchos]|uniref:Uncharacterized protein n=1 Tax=Anas platyrhynchos TaxID=8839 RepID=R0LLY8_ANAPL|nr:hypothetical protein Anapl_08908 [Anas platyrhynchos]
MPFASGFNEEYQLDNPEDLGALSHSRHERGEQRFYRDRCVSNLIPFGTTAAAGSSTSAPVPFGQQNGAGELHSLVLCHHEISEFPAVLTSSAPQEHRRDCPVVPGSGVEVS